MQWRQLQLQTPIAAAPQPTPPDRPALGLAVRRSAAVAAAPAPRSPADAWHLMLPASNPNTLQTMASTP